MYTYIIRRKGFNYYYCYLLIKRKEKRRGEERKGKGFGLLVSLKPPELVEFTVFGQSLLDGKDKDDCAVQAKERERERIKRKKERKKEKLPRKLKK